MQVVSLEIVGRLEMPLANRLIVFKLSEKEQRAVLQSI